LIANSIISEQLNFNFIIMHSGDVEWLTELPYTISIPFYNAVVVHAGFVPGLPIESQKPIDMYVIRTVPDTSGSDAAAGTSTAYASIETVHDAI
jgi:hypothetical protein